MCKITFQYYKKNSKVYEHPNMSTKLYKLIVDAVQGVGAISCEIIHVGIVGDKNHKATSYHRKNPPEAFDLRELILRWADGSMIHLVPMTNFDHRQLIADHWGGRALHINEDDKHHVHLDTKGAE